MSPNQSQTMSEEYPWRRELWPWFLMFFPAVAVIGGAITLALAIHTNEGLVSADYYKVGLAINRELHREQKAIDLNLKAEATTSNQSGLLRVRLTGDGVMPATLFLRIAHPTRAGMDQAVSLKLKPDGWYEGHAPHLQPARWRLFLEDPARSWRLEGIWNTTVGNSIYFPT